MKIFRIETFTDRFPFVGPIIYTLSIQYFLIQITVANAWPTPYSWLINPISDLGNTACGTFAGRFVCSPLHGLMNASFIVLGCTMAIGSLLIYQEFKENRGSLAGFVCMGLAGVGTILVGSFPENTIPAIHLIGALLPFFLGNVSLLVLGNSLQIPQPLRQYTIISGSIALAAFVLLVTHHYLGLHEGGMERLNNYPQTIWLFVFGAYMSRKHYEAIKQAAKIHA